MLTASKASAQVEPIIQEFFVTCETTDGSPYLADAQAGKSEELLSSGIFAFAHPSIFMLTFVISVVADLQSRPADDYCVQSSGCDASFCTSLVLEGTAWGSICGDFGFSMLCNDMGSHLQSIIDGCASDGRVGGWYLEAGGIFVNNRSLVARRVEVSTALSMLWIVLKPAQFVHV